MYKNNLQFFVVFLRYLNYHKIFRIWFSSQDKKSPEKHPRFSESQSITLANGKIVKNEIKAGHGGDCYAWNNCKENKKGQFSIDLTGTKLAFDPLVRVENFMTFEKLRFFKVLRILIEYKGSPPTFWCITSYK